METLTADKVDAMFAGVPMRLLGYANGAFAFQAENLCFILSARIVPDADTAFDDTMPFPGVAACRYVCVHRVEHTQVFTTLP